MIVERVIHPKMTLARQGVRASVSATLEAGWKISPRVLAEGYGERWNRQDLPFANGVSVPLPAAGAMGEVSRNAAPGGFLTGHPSGVVVEGPRL